MRPATSAPSLTLVGTSSTPAAQATIATAGAQQPPGTASSSSSGVELVEGPGTLQLLQFLMDAPDADAVLARACTGLGLIGDVAWAATDGEEVGDLAVDVTDAAGGRHRIDVALSDPASAEARARTGFILGLVAQIHARVAELDRLRAAVMTDPLTELWNRRGFEPLVEQAIARATRTGEAIALVLIDVDRFKEINDLHGHGAGDDALVQVSRALAGAIRPTDVAARLGGDEFALLLAGADASGASLVCERVRRALAPSGTGGVRVTLSFGVADAQSLDRRASGAAARRRWLEAADAALYDAKAAGRDTVACRRGPWAVVEDDTTRPICIAAS
jgi:diguanylate cyclase (GGDEF)-like protein